MFKILAVKHVGEMIITSVEGDVQLLKNGMELIDEKGNRFIIESIGMVHYKNIKDYMKFGELILKGDVKSIGKSLRIAP